MSNGIATYVGNTGLTQMHRHHAIQLIIPLEGVYSLFVENVTFEADAVLIQSNINHKHLSKNGRQLSIFVDTDTVLGNSLAANFPQPYHKFSLTADLKEKLKAGVSVSDAEALIHQVFQLAPHSNKTDERIDRLICQLDGIYSECLQIKNVMALIPLSESRLRHLFKAQTGVSLQRYLLWVKLRRAFVHLTQSASLSQAAYLAGFSDYAHLSRTVKEMFGINLSTLLKDSHLIQD